MQGSLAGPIGPARYILLAQKGQQLIENLENMSENKAESAKCVPCLRYDFSCWVLWFPMPSDVVDKEACNITHYNRGGTDILSF